MEPILEKKHAEIKQSLDKLEYEFLQLQNNSEVDNIEDLRVLESMLTMICKALYYVRSAQGALNLYCRETRVKNAPYNERR